MYVDSTVDTTHGCFGLLLFILEWFFQPVQIHSDLKVLFSVSPSQSLLKSFVYFTCAHTTLSTFPVKTCVSLSPQATLTMREFDNNHQSSVSHKATCYWSQEKAGGHRRETQNNMTIKNFTFIFSSSLFIVFPVTVTYNSNIIFWSCKLFRTCFIQKVWVSFYMKDQFYHKF